MTRAWGYCNTRGIKGPVGPSHSGSRIICHSTCYFFNATTFTDLQSSYRTSFFFLSIGYALLHTPPSAFFSPCLMSLTKLICMPIHP